MKTSNLGQYLTTVSPCIWWLSDKIEKRSRRKHLAEDNDAIDNLERVYRLKERGVITEEDFIELKNKLKQQI